MHPNEIMKADLLSEVLLFAAAVAFVIACFAIALVALHVPSL